MKEQDKAYFECIEYNIQFDGVLPAYRVVDLACISQREENRDGDDEEKHAKKVGLLRWRQGRGGGGK